MIVNVKLNCNNEDSIKHAFQCHVIKNNMEKYQGSFNGIWKCETTKSCCDEFHTN